MATQSIFIGDTITLQGAFRDANNNLIDTDTNSATATIYDNESLAQVVSGTATRLSTGIYIYDWVVPDGDGLIYVLEIKGIFNSEPQLNRIKVKAKFRP